MKTIGFPWSYGDSEIPKAPNLGISQGFPTIVQHQKPFPSTGPAMGSAVLRPQHLRNRVWLVNHTDLGKLTGNSSGPVGFPLLFKGDSLTTIAVITKFSGGDPWQSPPIWRPTQRETVAIFEPLFFLVAPYTTGAPLGFQDQRNAQYRWFKLATLPSVICYNDHILDCLHLRSFRTELGMFDCDSGPSQNVKEQNKIQSHQKRSSCEWNSTQWHNDKVIIR